MCTNGKTSLPRLAETAAALEESIDHWQDLLDQACGLVTGRRHHRIGYESCSLCQRFNLDGVGDCKRGSEKCPVYERTGLPYCEGSPYENVSFHWHREEAGSAQLIRAVQAELDFLKSLRVADPKINREGESHV